MSIINTNVKSMFSQSALNQNNRSMAHSMQKLSTGNRINDAKDDAAGLAIVQNMTAQIRGLNQAIRNANDAIGLLQTAEGAMIEQTNMLQRMRELAVQAATDTVSETQKGYLAQEFNQLREEINRIGNDTQWNGSNILNGDSPLATGTNKAFEFQVGANANQKLTISVGDMRISGATDSLLNDVAGKTISSSAGAQTTIGDIDKALNAINSQRATIGAVVNRLTFAVDNLTNVSMNAEASRSQVQDTDYASATTELSRTQIIQQAATAMLAQANQQPATVLSLLR